jgi:hypothetical protein
MDQPSTEVARFFQTYELLISNDDIPALVSLFEDVFLAAGPQGAKSVRAEDFALALPKRKQLFDKLGCQSTVLISLHETALDGRYTLAKTKWRMTFHQPTGNQEVVVDSTFLLDMGRRDPKILLYLASQDIMEILKDRGILAN